MGSSSGRKATGPMRPYVLNDVTADPRGRTYVDRRTAWRRSIS